MRKHKQNLFKSMRFENGQFFLGEEKYTYKKFLKKYIWLHLIIIVTLILAIIATIFVYTKGFKDGAALGEPDCWATIIAFTLSYLGASFLGLVVFYNTCQRQYLEDRDTYLKFNMTACPMSLAPLQFYTEEILNNVAFKCWGAQSHNNNEEETEGKGYLKFNFTNYNYRYPMYIEIVGVYYADVNNNIVDAKSIDFKLTKENDSPLDYKEDCSIYVGINNSILTQLPKTIAYIFKFKNVKGIEEYCVYFATLNENTESCVIKRISVDEYEQSMKKNNHPLGMWEIYLKMVQPL